MYSNLPNAIADVDFPDACSIEFYKNMLLGQYRLYGYDLVLPPIVEFADILVPQKDEELDLQTFKCIDQLSGKLLGLRADMTPQISRIASAKLSQHGDTPLRICYVGDVVHTKPRYLGAWRNPLQIGIEIFNGSVPDSEIEVILLLLKSLEKIGISHVILNLGYSNILDLLLDNLGIESQLQQDLLKCFHNKCISDLKLLLDQHINQSYVKQLLLEYAYLYGDINVLQRAIVLLKDFPTINSYVESLYKITAQVDKYIKLQGVQVSLYVDMTQNTGYSYQEGIIFSAYSAETKKVLAQGGCYNVSVGDNLYKAVGFSADLKQLLATNHSLFNEEPRILAPIEDDAKLQALISRLREQNNIVVEVKNISDSTALYLRCSKRIVLKNNMWQLESVN